MTDLPNGFTGFSHRDPNFVSAGDALRGSRYDDTPFAARKQAQARNLAEAWSPAASERAGAGVAAEGGSDAAARGASRSLSQLSSAASDVLRFAEQGTQATGAPRFDPDKLARIPETDRRWAWVEIDLNAIRHNASAVKRRLNPGTRLMAVVKADGYGHGAVQCAKTALNSGAEYLGVATVDEAIALREAYVNAPILILGEPPATAIPLLLAYKIMPAVYTAEFAIRYAEAADAFGVSAPFHLKVNTGMNRIGVRWDEVVEFARQISFHRALDLVGTFTHFATADCPGTIDFERQVKRFSEAVNALRAAGINPGIVHAANSAAAIRYPRGAAGHGAPRHFAVRILPVPRGLPDDRSEAGHEREGPHHRCEDAAGGRGRQLRPELPQPRRREDLHHAHRLRRRLPPGPFRPHRRAAGRPPLPPGGQHLHGPGPCSK